MDYDFDIFDMAPQQAGPDPDTSGFLARLGSLARKGRSGCDETGAPPDRIALFRSARTADALRRAPEGLRDYFLAAGFGLNTYASGAPRHCYPATDEEARLEIIERLAELAPSYSLPGPADYPEGGDVFRLGEFLADLALARPLDEAALPQDRATHPDLAPPDRQAMHGLPPTFDTEPPVPTVMRRRFWHSRYFMAAVGAAVVLALVQLSMTLDPISLASL